jgi:RimJ/RimL family protein N-acetyltransferase
VEESLEIIRTVFNDGANRTQSSSLELLRCSPSSHSCNDALHTWAIVLKETGETMEQREQSDACIDSTESRQRKTEGQPIGAMGYGPSCECDLPAREGEPLIGYWVAKPYWNRGICTEALRLMIDHIHQTTDIKSLISGHFVDNPASGRVMEKCGFIPTGETCIDANQYQGANRPIRVLRLELKTNMDNLIKQEQNK